MQQYDIDPELLAGFVDDSLEGLEPLDAFFIELEKDPARLEHVDAIFRPIHSIKGSAAFFGLLRIKTLAHKMEDLLDRMRRDQIKASPPIIQALLPGLDMLRSMFANIREGLDETEEESGIEAIVDALEKICKMETENTAECPQLLPQKQGDAAGTRTTAATSDDPLTAVLAILKTPFKDVLDEASSKEVWNLMAVLLQMADSDETKAILTEALEEYDAFMQHIGFDVILQESLTEKMERLLEKGCWKTSQDAAAKTEKTELEEAEKIKRQADKPLIQKERFDRRSGQDRRAASTASSEKTMRVSEKDVDAFLSCVSELVVVEEMFNFLQKKLIASREKGMAEAFKRVIETFSSLSGNLRKSILSIRMIPARVVLQKAPRIVHDIAAARGKKVDVQIQGDDTRIDKRYIELLDAPFTHMVRNAVDHGIEPAEQRASAGKEETGIIRIELQERKKEIELVIQDDGKGLDTTAVSQKAQELGMITKGQALSEDAVIDLIFMPGVSTAAEVSDVSGRGVGMDVVKRNIQAAGGKIRIESSPGMGTTFRISLPKTVSTQIMEGFLFRAGTETYVMSMNLVGESFALQPENMSTVEGKGEVVLRRGDLMPVVRLRQRLHEWLEKSGNGDQRREEAPNGSVAISVAVDNRRHALCVDEIIGVQKVVLREIEGLQNQESTFDGAAILGDGSVALIIGNEGLRQLIS